MAETRAEPPPPAHDSHHHWGYLFKSNKCPTDLLDRLLRGIAACISSTFASDDCRDLTPQQLAAFYRLVDGDYDRLFLDMPGASIAYIYKSLGCLHSLQPDQDAADGVYAAPCVPALKPKGYVTWQTIQLLLGPDEHVPFIQKALQTFDVRDPEDGKPFPKDLPREAFPMHPDEQMVAWHEGVSERLRIEAQKEMAQEQQRHSGHLAPRPRNRREVSSDSLDGPATSEDERADAVRYFANPLNRNHDGRPAIVRNLSKAPTFVFQGGKAVAITAKNTVRNIMDPHLWSGSPQHESPHNARRRRSAADVDSPLSPTDSAAHRNAPYPQSHSRTSSGHQPRFSRVDYDSERPSSQARGPTKMSPREDRASRRLRQNWSSTDSDDARDDDTSSPARYLKRSDEPKAFASSHRRHRSQDPTPVSSGSGYFDDWARNPRPHNYRQAAFQSPQSQGTPMSPRPQRSYSYRHPESRSPSTGRPRRRSTDGESRSREETPHRPAAPLETRTAAPSGGLSHTSARPSQIPYYGPRSGPANPVQRTRDGERAAANASPRPRFAEIPINLHPGDATSKMHGVHRRRGSNHSANSPASGGEDHDSERREERMHRRREGETPRQGTPVQGVSGRRYVTAEAPWDV